VGISSLGADLDFLLEVFHGHQGLAVQVATPLREDLVLNVHAGSPRLRIHKYRLRTHLSLPEACVCICYQGEATALVDI